MALKIAYFCDEPGCEKHEVGETRGEARAAIRAAGWAEPIEGGTFCPDHFPLDECDWCGRPMRPWGKRRDDPGMQGTVPYRSGGRCATCYDGRYERLLERAVQDYYERSPTMFAARQSSVA